MNDYEKNEIEFTHYIQELKKVYNEDPKLGVKIARKSMDIIKQEENMKNNNGESPYLRGETIFGDVNKKTFLLVCMCIMVALIGLYNIQNYGLYLFGVVFFLAGFFIGLYVPVFGLIFLFSHGGSGFGLMIWSLIGDSLSDPILLDEPTNIYIYLGIGIVLIVIALLLTFLHNLSAKFKEKEYGPLIPLALLIIVLLMAARFPGLMHTLYSL